MGAREYFLCYKIPFYYFTYHRPILFYPSFILYPAKTLTKSCRYFFRPTPRFEKCSSWFFFTFRFLLNITQFSFYIHKETSNKIRTTLLLSLSVNKVPFPPSGSKEKKCFKIPHYHKNVTHQTILIIISDF